MLLVIRVVSRVVHASNRRSQGGSLVSGKAQQLGRCDEVISRPSSQAEDERRVVGLDLEVGVAERATDAARGTRQGRGCDPACVRQSHQGQQRTPRRNLEFILNFGGDFS